MSPHPVLTPTSSTRLPFPWCARGHDLTDPDNVRISDAGKRTCRVCARERNRAYEARKAAERAAQIAADTPAPVTRRWPVEPLLEAAEMTQGELGDLLGVHRRTVQRMIDRGLTDTEADHAACLIRLHPAFIWGWDEWAAAPLAAELVAS
jgi:hypothetical protein